MRPSAVDRTPVEPADTPPSLVGLQVALEVDEGLRGLFVRGTEFLDLVEATFGLRLGQLRSLNAIGDATTTLERIARRTGEHPAAATATLASLHDLGLVQRNDDDRVALTEVGRARRDQLIALALRITAHLADEPAPGPGSAVVHRLPMPTPTVVDPSHPPVA